MLHAESLHGVRGQDPEKDKAMDAEDGSGLRKIPESLSAVFLEQIFAAQYCILCRADFVPANLKSP